MKKYNIIKLLTATAAALFMTACSWVKEPAPGVTELEDYFVSGQACINNVTANYVPLVWEFQSTYYSEWFIGDVMSDDAIKGGQNVSDMSQAYELENFKSNADNEIAYDFYGAQYQGIARCNLSLTYIPDVACDSVMTQSVKDRLIGECYFLRAYYYFRLVRAFGGVPLTLQVENSDERWAMPRETTENVYKQIISDLTEAERLLWNKSEYASEDLGRATKGAAQAMLMKAYLYQGKYTEAEQWGAKFLLDQESEYSLTPNFADNFTLAGENNCESVFEFQYANESTSDYGTGNGSTRGTFTTILTRSRATNMGDEGWGFNKPTQNLYNEYEENDPRRDATIMSLQGEYASENDIYLGNSYLNRKSGMYNADGSGYTYKIAHASRGVLNNKQIRLADVLLMYAEACEENGNTIGAEDALERVRARARANAPEGAINPLPEYPNYTIKINGVEKTPTLKEAIRHERRMELAMEGHRWFDLCRWGVAVEVMNAYRETETPEARAEMSEMRPFQTLLPIPHKQILLNSALTQNPEY
ncbi:MAG: SusD family protein [Bacteroidetes bacterium ADurb.Bin302]|nr:MAG: SusD family protein [Bacteroidetes bacterium ADurb.Bin302]